MFIELTDHLRCPREHDEAFLVLVPDRMQGRRVIAGRLGCPVCDWHTEWTEGVPDFGAAPAASDNDTGLDAAGALALLGLDGPGGWVALAGGAGTLAADLAALLPDVHLVAINPPATVLSEGAVSVIRSGVWPIKRHALRGVVVGADAADHAAAAIASVLPGLRAAGEGALPVLGTGDEVVAEAPGLWVVRHR